MNVIYLPLNNCRMFDSVTHDFNNTEGSGCSDFKSKPDGWETTSKAQDENVWEMSQREEDILLQEFDRRIAYCKFQVCQYNLLYWCTRIFSLIRSFSS